MKNAGLTIGMCAIGLGLASIGLNLNGNTANATPAAFNAGPAEPTIVWYGIEEITQQGATGSPTESHAVYRAWSDGTIELRIVSDEGANFDPNCNSLGTICVSAWTVVSSPNEGLRAAADINFDERVDAADLGQLIAAWGDAPRNDHPPSDCPLGLIP